MPSKPVFTQAELGKRYFQWTHIPYVERIHWNYILQRVVQIDSDPARAIMDPRTGDKLESESAADSCPNFYNQDACLALTLCPSTVADTGPDAKPNKKLTDGPIPINLTERLKGGGSGACVDFDGKASTDELSPYIIRPTFNYHRRFFELMHFNGSGITPEKLDGYSIQSLTIGSVVWLYFYERMGIFKILGALLDDYNYRGRYSFSSQVKNNVLKNKAYVELMEHLSILARQGLSSTLRDRVSTYQRVLGVSIDNDLNVQTTANDSFMKNFSKLIQNMLEYYNAKRLAVAIQTNSMPLQVRSSVATQTAILNTIKVLSQNFEVMEYGRNMIHTFTGIATVYATLCLLRQVRDVIGIPGEFDTPEEYVPAAYDILVLKKQGRSSDTNRYTVFDSCASYGYRLLTDVQSANMGSFALGEINSPFDAWLSSVEEWVEGYNNAFKSIPDKTGSEAAVATV